MAAADEGATGKSVASARTLPELFARRVKASPAGQAYRQFNHSTGDWSCVTWAAAGDSVRRWSLAMAALHLPGGARVALLLPNGLNAVWADQAAMALGCVPVPLHALDNPGSIAYILADCAASLLFVQSERQWADIAATGVPLPALQRVVVTGDEPLAEHSAGPVPVVRLDDWLAARGQGDHPALVPPSEDDLACIVYTSGTTGKPKGVMLSHRNVISNVKGVMAHAPTQADDVFLSFLPLSHTFERTAGYYLPIAAGSCVAFARSVALLAEDLRTVRPTVLVSVPRIYERVHTQIEVLLSASPFKARLFKLAEAVGWRRFCIRQGLALAPSDQSPWAWADGLVWPLLNLLVARPLLARFGGRVRVAVSGGAALSPVIARCFLGLGLPVLQGYGMTETSPVVAANTLDNNDPATVGTVLQGVEVRLGENRELLVRGPSVMKGYWNRPDDTERVLSPDGWLRTGDQASIENGRVRILGRIKEIIVTSTGEKIAPGDLELAIANDPLFEQVLVVGENRPFIAAVAVVNASQWTALTAELKVDPGAPESLGLPQVQEAAVQRIARQTTSFPRYGVPKAVSLSLEPWTVENSLMTPTLKLKRNNLMARFGREIDAMYRAR